MIDVRLYEDSDLESVNKILYDSFSITKDNFDDEDIIEIVASVDNIVAGYLFLTKVFNPIKKKHYCLIDYVCIDIKYRGMGVGKKLVDYALEIAKDTGAMYAQLTCGYKRIEAHKLYEKCGFIKRESDIFRKEFL